MRSVYCVIVAGYGKARLAPWPGRSKARQCRVVDSSLTCAIHASARRPTPWTRYSLEPVPARMKLTPPASDRGWFVHVIAQILQVLISVSYAMTWPVRNRGSRCDDQFIGARCIVSQELHEKIFRPPPGVARVHHGDLDCRDGRAVRAIERRTGPRFRAPAEEVAKPQSLYLARGVENTLEVA